MRKEKRLYIKYAELCKVLFSTARFSEIEKKYKKITAQEILIADVGDLKIRSHYKALVSMMEEEFFDSAGEEEVKRILKKMDEERDAKHKIKRRQEIHRDAVMQKNKLQKTIFAAFESSRCLTSSETTSSSNSSLDTE